MKENQDMKILVVYIWLLSEKPLCDVKHFLPQPKSFAVAVYIEKRFSGSG